MSAKKAFLVISHKSAQNHTKSPHPAPHKACRFYQAALTPPRIDHYPTNDPESRLPAGLLDIGVSKRQIAVISKTDMPDADVAATRKLLLETGFEEPIFELNSHDPQSVQQLVDYLASLTKQEEAGEKTHHSE